MAAKKMTDIGQKLSTRSLDPGISSPIGIATPVESSEKFSGTPSPKGQFDCRTESPTSTNYQRSGSVSVSQQAPHRQYPRRKESCLGAEGKKEDYHLCENRFLIFAQDAKRFSFKRASMEFDYLYQVGDPLIPAFFLDYARDVQYQYSAQDRQSGISLREDQEDLQELHRDFLKTKSLLDTDCKRAWTELPRLVRSTEILVEKYSDEESFRRIFWELAELDAQLSFMFAKRPYLDPDLEFPRPEFSALMTDECLLHSIIVEISSSLIGACHMSLQERQVNSYRTKLLDQYARLSALLDMNVRSDLWSTIRGYQFIVKVLLLALDCGNAESAGQESVVKSVQEILDMFDDGKAYLQGLFQIYGAYCALAVLATSLDDLSPTSEKWRDLINALHPKRPVSKPSSTKSTNSTNEQRITDTNTPRQGQLKMSSEGHLSPSTPPAQASPPHITAVTSSDVPPRAQSASLGVGSNTVYHNFGWGTFQYPFDPWSQRLSAPMNPWSQDGYWTSMTPGRSYLWQNQT
ncbi:hypothetical protein LTR93_011419 [Exophiala xenobiotica]|nr:hypothetical protein LTR93_011419 [Exophiala xenobiotica]